MHGFLSTRSMSFKRRLPLLIVALSVALAIVLAIGAAALGPLASSAQYTAAQSVPSADTAQFFDDYISQYMAEAHIPGAVVIVVERDEVVFAKGYGLANLERQTPFDPAETLLTTASIAKAFTAVGLLQLIERGAVGLNEDIRPYLQDIQPAFRFDQPLTPFHLLTHTDGFESSIGVVARTPESFLSLAELLRAYRPNQLFPPGQYLTYSDYAANLAGYLIQTLSEKPFETYMAENIFQPLGMTDSTFEQFLSDDQLSRLAQAYEYEAGTHVAMPQFYISATPAGGLRTTAADMGIFLRALLNGGEWAGARILTPDSVTLMFAQQFTQLPDMPGITLGLFEDVLYGYRIVLRDGDGVGTRSRLFLVPELNTGVFVSYNSDDSRLRLDLPGAYLAHRLGLAAPLRLNRCPTTPSAPRSSSARTVRFRLTCQRFANHCTSSPN